MDSKTVRARTGNREVLVHVVGQWYAVHGSRTVNRTRQVVGASFGGDLDLIVDDKAFTTREPITSPGDLRRATRDVNLGSL